MGRPWPKQREINIAEWTYRAVLIFTATVIALLIIWMVILCFTDPFMPWRKHYHGSGISTNAPAANLDVTPYQGDDLYVADELEVDGDIIIHGEIIQPHEMLQEMGGDTSNAPTRQ